MGNNNRETLKAILSVKPLPEKDQVKRFEAALFYPELNGKALQFINGYLVPADQFKKEISRETGSIATKGWKIYISENFSTPSNTTPFDQLPDYIKKYKTDADNT